MNDSNQFKPVKGSNLSQKIMAQIEAGILSGEIEPGRKLSSERDLQNQFKVGRGAIREALQALKQKGIIEIKKGVKGGVYAKKIGINNASESLSILLKQNMVPLDHLVEFRDTIDQSEVILASIRGTSEEKETLVNMSHKLLDLDNDPDGPAIEKIKSVDREMNLLLAKMTRNLVFEWIIGTIQMSIGSYDSLLYDHPQYRRRTIENWINTAREIADGEPLKALSFCSYHYVMLQDCIREKTARADEKDDSKEK